MINKLYTLIKKYIIPNLIFIISVIVILLLFNIRLNVSINAPGGIINVDNRLSNTLYNNKGTSNLTYVRFIPGTIPTVLLSYILPDWDIIDNNTIKYDNEELIDANKRDVIRLYGSISAATYIAYNKANLPINIKSESFYVTYIYDEADTTLKVGDRILEYDGNKYNELNEFKEYISSKDIGYKIKLKVSRNKKEIEVTAKVNEIEDTKLIGVLIEKVNTYDKDTLLYKYGSSESGASGGLMMSISMYNSLVKEDITYGKKVCGTGTIDFDGNVGEISGVKYKLLGAIKNDCDMFIVPSSNYKEALKVRKNKKSNITIIKADNFDSVLNSIKEEANK